MTKNVSSPSEAVSPVTLTLMSFVFVPAGIVERPADPRVVPGRLRRVVDGRVVDGDVLAAEHREGDGERRLGGPAGVALGHVGGVADRRDRCRVVVLDRARRARDHGVAVVQQVHRELLVRLVERVVHDRHRDRPVARAGVETDASRGYRRVIPGCHRRAVRGRVLDRRVRRTLDRERERPGPLGCRDVSDRGRRRRRRRIVRGRPSRNHDQREEQHPRNTSPPHPCGTTHRPLLPPKKKRTWAWCSTVPPRKIEAGREPTRTGFAQHSYRPSAVSILSDFNIYTDRRERISL